MLTRTLSSLFQFLYPGRCPCCDGFFESSGMLCDKCSGDLALLESAPACRWCARPLTLADAPCPFCLGKGLPHLERIVRLGAFKQPIQALVHQLKYHRRWPVGEFLADRLLEQERTKEMLSETNLLMAVPLHPYRQIHRAYNQAGVIAARLSANCGIPLVRPIARQRHTETQTHLHSLVRRRENLRGAFKLRERGTLAGKHVVLIDDVMTTGATLHALASAAAEDRPASLSAIVIAVADPRGRDFQTV